MLEVLWGETPPFLLRGGGLEASKTHVLNIFPASKHILRKTLAKNHGDVKNVLSFWAN